MISYSRSYDIVAGLLLATNFIIGTLTNIFCLTYFLGLNSGANKNKRYFKNLYTIICFVDLAISLMLPPNIAAAFSINRSGSMFTNQALCLVWGIAWPILSQTSIFLVVLLSISRLLVLKYATRSVLQPFLAWVIPGIFIAGSTATHVAYVSLLARSTGNSTSVHPTKYMQYRPMFLACSFPTPTSSGEELERSLLMGIIPGLAFLVIASSFITSLVLISKNVARSNRGGSARMHRHATVTVIIVILVYAACNIPVFVISAQLLRKKEKMDARSTSPLDAEQYGMSLSKLFMGKYMFLIMKVLSVSVNSAVNPVVYFFRMSRFRCYVMEAVGFSRNNNAEDFEIPMEPIIVPRPVASLQRSRIQASHVAPDEVKYVKYRAVSVEERSLPCHFQS